MSYSAKLPGLTAGVSIYASTRSYRVAVPWATESLVQPQLIHPGGTCMSRCIQSCGDDPECGYNCNCICHGPPHCHLR
jgi:hypothetical protein